MGIKVYKPTTLHKILAVILVTIFLINFSRCTDEHGARKTLERNNYHPINVGGYGWFSGSKEDVYITRFKAVAPNGDTVTGCVTKGLLKGNTIRLDD